MFSSYLSGPRWIDLESILRLIAHNNNVGIRFGAQEKKWLSKRIHFTIFSTDKTRIDHFIKELGEYNGYAVYK